MQTLTLSLADLSIAFIPVVAVIWLMWRNAYPIKKPLIALARMLLQLLLVGYFLVYIFAQNSPFIILTMLSIMMLAASWIALNVVEQRTMVLFFSVFIALLFGGGSILFIITQGVMHISPWYQAKTMIPLAGMIFASSMTGISIALERLNSETANQQIQQQTIANHTYQISFQAAMIPVVNTMFAVGVVALPGMMTGQILSGVAPYIAARYQIMVMCMIFSATGLSVYLFLHLHQRLLAHKRPVQS